MANHQIGIQESELKHLKDLVSDIDQARKGKGTLNIMLLRDRILNLSKACVPGSFAEIVLLDQVKYINEYGLRADLNVLFEKLELFLNSTYVEK